jgi:hypothetical protein
MWVAISAFVFGAGTLNAQTQNKPTVAPGQMTGMDMGAKPDRGYTKPNIPAGVLRITFGDKSADWTLAKLTALPHKTLTVYNEHTKANETYSGVALMDLLTPLGVPATLRGKDLSLYFVAVGSDGYQAVYAVAEANSDVHDGMIVVADLEDGKPLTDDGPLKIISTGEKRPARWVRNLVLVRVAAAQ